MRKSPESGRIYEPKYYLFWSVYRRAHDPAAAPKDAPNEATDCRVRNSKDVPVLWVDHISTKGVLLGVRQVSYIGGAFGYTQVNRDFSCDVFGQSTDSFRCGYVRRKVPVHCCSCEQLHRSLSSATPHGAALLCSSAFRLDRTCAHCFLGRKYRKRKVNNISNRVRAK